MIESNKIGSIFNLSKKSFLLLFIFFSNLVILNAQDKKGLNILLVGDSTTIGSLPRQVNPDGLHLEDMIEQLAEISNLPKLNVINTGRGGETAQRLLASKWYIEKIASEKNIDYIIVRLGINDWFKCKDFLHEFPGQMNALIKQLKKDHPKAKIVLATICRFMSDKDCTVVNNLIKYISRNEKLLLFDLYPAYNDYLLKNGENSLSVRQPNLKLIPKEYHTWLKPYTYLQKSGKDKGDEYVVKVNDTSLDPIFGHIKGWYNDRHPNSEGYNLIAAETVKFLKKTLAPK